MLPVRRTLPLAKPASSQPTEAPMSLTIRHLILAIALVSTSLVAWLLVQGLVRDERTALPLTAQGYPPPDGAPTSVPQTPVPSPTPSSDGGYFPPPAGIDHRIETLAASPYRDLLLALQAALDAGDPSPPADWVSERFGNRLFDIRSLDSEGGVMLDRDTTRATLGAFLEQGSRPRIQGYFAVDDGEIACLDVLTAVYEGDVAFPGPWDPLGPPPPEVVPPDAAAFHACRDQLGTWLWQTWAYGGYHEIVAMIDARLEGSGTVYNVSRP